MDKLTELEYELKEAYSSVQEAVEKLQSLDDWQHFQAAQEELNQASATFQKVLDKAHHVLEEAVDEVRRSSSQARVLGIDLSPLEIEDLSKVTVASVDAFIHYKQMVSRSKQMLDERQMAFQQKRNEVDELLHNIDEALDQLRQLGEDGESLGDGASSLSKDREVPEKWDAVLAEGASLLREIRKQIEGAEEAQRKEIQQLSEEATQLKAQLPSDSREARRLQAILHKVSPELEGRSLLRLKDQLDTAIQQARGVLALYDPEASIDELRRLLPILEAPENLVDEDIASRVGQMLESAAKTREGYKGLVWRAGSAILRELRCQHERYADEFYEIYGYQAVANAFLSSAEQGFFLEALGVLDSDFLQAGDGIELLNNETINSTLEKIFHSRLLPLSLSKTLAEVSLPSSEALICFIQAVVSRSWGLPGVLQLSAWLFKNTPYNSPEYESVSRTFFKILASDGRPVSAYYGWRAFAEEWDCWGDSEFIETLQALIRCFVDGEERYLSLMCELCLDEDLRLFASEALPLQFLLGSLGIYLYLGHQKSEGLAPSWELISTLYKTYPLLASSLQQGVSGESLPIEDETDEVHKVFWQLVHILDHELRPRHREFDEVSLAIQIHQDNLQTIFEPIRDALVAPEPVSESILDDLTGLDARKLVQNHTLQRAARPRIRIRGSLLTRMIRDTEVIISALQELANQRAKLDAFGIAPHKESSTSVEREIDQLTQMYPVVSWSIEHLIQPMMSL